MFQPIAVNISERRISSMDETRYRKPNLNNLPYDLGRAIIDEILNSEPVDRKRLRKEADELEAKIIKIRREEAKRRQAL